MSSKKQGGARLNNDYVVKKVESKETHDFILNLHYAKRLPSISYAFGMYLNNELIAVLTIGKPASNSLCVGICGKENASKVYELNRLVTKKQLEKNALSFFVGKVLKLLSKEELIIVSYADEGMNHHGYIYQATNWWYTGKTKSRTDKYVIPGKHSRHYTNKDNHLRRFRSSKYRYVYVPNKRLKKYVLKNMNYPILEKYPKGDNERYILGERMKQKVLNKETKEIYYE